MFRDWRAIADGYDPPRLLLGETWVGDLSPAVIISNDAASSTATRLGRGVVTVVPVTSSTERVHRVLSAAGDPAVLRPDGARAADGWAMCWRSAPTTL